MTRFRIEPCGGGFSVSERSRVIFCLPWPTVWFPWPVLFETEESAKRAIQIVIRKEGHHEIK